MEVKMGTYTTNYQLYTPTVGETGWGTLVNGNFTTIDTTMKGLDTRLTAVENEVNGALSCTSVTTSGKITGNGGIAGTTGTFSGAVTGSNFNGVVLKSSGTITVTPLSNIDIQLPVDEKVALTLLPPKGNCLYSGSVKFTRTDKNNSYVVNYADGKNTYDSYVQSLNINKGVTYTFSFTNIPYLVVYAPGRKDVFVSRFTLS